MSERHVKRWFYSDYGRAILNKFKHIIIMRTCGAGGAGGTAADAGAAAVALCGRLPSGYPVSVSPRRVKL